MVSKKQSAFLLWLIFANITHAERRNSNIDKTPDDFEKYWDLFDLFLPCTIHFTRAPESWLDMQNSFLIRCSQLKYCVALQTAYTYRQRDHRFGLILRETWKQKFEKNVTHIFWNLFGSHHFHDVCFVRLAFSTIKSPNTINGWDSKGQGRMLPSRNYILFAVNFKNNNDQNQKKYIVSPSLGNSRLLCLNKNYASAIMACLTCLDMYTVSELNWQRWKPLVTLPQFPASINHLYAVWKFYHSNRQNR